MTRVSIVIPNLNGMPHLPVCLDALDGQTFRDFDVIVVDNGSTDTSNAYVTSRGAQFVSLGGNMGFPAAVNAGIERSTGDYVVLLNNDTRAEPTWLEHLVRAMDSHDDFGFGSSKLVRFDDPTRIDSVGHTYSLWLGSAMRVGDNDASTSYERPAWIFGANAAGSIYRREVFDDIGMFDDSFFFGHEDVEFDLRANVAGYRCLFVADAVVAHKRGATYDASAEIKRMDIRNRLWAAGTNLPPLALFLWALAKPARVVAAPFRRRRVVSDSSAGPSAPVPWDDIGMRESARTVLGALRELPARRRATKGVRRIGSVALIRRMRTTRAPQPIHG